MGGVKELYNLKNDIGERNNLAEQYPKKIKCMLKQLRKMQKKSNAKFPVLKEKMNR